MTPSTAFEDLEQNSPPPYLVKSSSWSLRSQTIVRDSRWHGIDPVPVTAALFFLSLLLIALTGGELFLGFAIFPLIILLISVLTTVHTVLDLTLYLNEHLPPVYSLCMSVMMLIFWIFGVGLGVADVAKGSTRGPRGAGYGYCIRRYEEGYYKRLGCLVPRARLVDQVIVMILYIVSIGISSIAYRRHRNYVFGQIYAQRCICEDRHLSGGLSTIVKLSDLPKRGSLAVAYECEVVASKEIGIPTVSVPPAVPERSASRLSSRPTSYSEGGGLVGGKRWDAEGRMQALPEGN